MKLAVIQFTPEFGKKEENLSRIRLLTESIQADVIVLPELCATGYFFLSREETLRVSEPADGLTASFFRELSKEKKAVVVAGFAERDGDHIYNSCLVSVPEIPATYIYRKTHLFYKECFCFDPGNTGFFVIEDSMRDIRIGPMICYDWRFPESARILTLLGADLIVCPANLVTEAWKVVMPARAVENMVYLAVSNRGGTEIRRNEKLTFKGQSAIYDYHGCTLCSAGPTQDTVLEADIFPEKTRDKSFNSLNNIICDRRPEYYEPLVLRDSSPLHGPPVKGGPEKTSQR